MAVENPATKPAADSVDGDNLTAQQAALILAVFEDDPNAVLDAATDLEMSEDDVDGLLSMLSEMAGEDDDAETPEDEADPNDEPEEAE
jgi:hypothetical protein